MRLDDYLKQPDSMSVAELSAAIGVKDDAQVRQWRNPNTGRQPSPRYCVAIEVATCGTVRRQDLRPDDWHLIWPELAKKEKRRAAREAA